MPEPERETLELDVVFVGAGPASLAGALHLARLVEQHNEAGQSEPLEPSIAVLEKGKEIGSHALSGAVLDPRALEELCPDDWQDAPLEADVDRERVLYLTARRAVPFPLIPPPLRNHGNAVVSLGKLLKWLAPKVEAAGVDIFCEFPAAEALLEGERVTGVRTADRGLDKDGNPKANYEPGIDLDTRCVVLGEGPRGTLTKQLQRRLELSREANPQTYSIGIKELWRLPEDRFQPGEVWHTMGWPLPLSEFGGGFLYGMRDGLLIVGLVAGLDYADPYFDPHTAFQQLKTHPEIRRLLDGGEMIGYGAKAIPEGGWWARPRSYGDGFLIIGDSAGLLNSQRLKGIHLGMKSGMLAAETIFESLRDGETGRDRLRSYEERIRASWIRDELWPVRNFHQAMAKGVVPGMVQAGLGLATGGRGWGVLNRLGSAPGHTEMEHRDGRTPPPPLDPDDELTFDRLADVYQSGTVHEEDQPVHLLVHDTDICHDRCVVEYGNPCQRFCPASVYEMVDDPSQPHGLRLQINASNCVHCKTCDIMDPYEIITWVPPEGGGGPNYGRM